MTDWLKADIIERRQWTDDLFSLRFHADITPFKAGQFIQLALDIEGERIKRPYSLVNAPHETCLEVYFNIVQDGPLSTRLATLHPGDNVWVSSGANGFLTLDEIPEARHLWFFATGTGIGPFISILKTEQPWPRFDHIVLAHSVMFARQLAYRDVIDSLLTTHSGQLHYVPYVTREITEGTLHTRIPASIASGKLEKITGVSLHADNSHVMLCGNAGMIADVSEELAKRDMRRHRRREPGHITTEKYH